MQELPNIFDVIGNSNVWKRDNSLALKTRQTGYPDKTGFGDIGLWNFTRLSSACAEDDIYA